ncbi:hypothetical protein M8J75_005506 [Diaphorina citri]|nr:hypothetical protein M8J75_005506 [Diaphorina citri]
MRAANFCKAKKLSSKYWSIMSEQNLPREERTAYLVNALTNNQYREIDQIKERLMKLDSDECLDGGQNLNLDQRNNKYLELMRTNIQMVQKLPSK